ncbi:MAG: ThuA domain-containing protein [Alphaproteobacteria bacterium]|nr:MAG: ThuA domain-containing protein [Alphaproteobacteria bacterium]
MKKGRIDVYLVAGGKYHDIDFARLELLKLLHADERFRVRVGEDYRDIEAIRAADFLMTYTCDVVPTESELAGLKAFLADGKRWFALHGTNSILQFLKDGRVDSPDKAPEFMEILGTQFVAHPPICTYRVDVSDPDHALTRGIEPFEVEDELYLSRDTGDYHLLLETHFEGKAPGFVVEDWVDDRPQPVLYLRSYGNGEVLYLTLGHCRGKYDLQSLGVEEYEPVERCSWQYPIYYELLRRGIAWAAGDLEG